MNDLKKTLTEHTVSEFSAQSLGLAWGLWVDETVTEDAAYFMTSGRDQGPDIPFKGSPPTNDLNFFDYVQNIVLTLTSTTDNQAF